MTTIEYRVVQQDLPFLPPVAPVLHTLEAAETILTNLQDFARSRDLHYTFTIEHREVGPWKAI